MQSMGILLPAVAVSDGAAADAILILTKRCMQSTKCAKSFNETMVHGVVMDKALAQLACEIPK